VDREKPDSGKLNWYAWEGGGSKGKYSNWLPQAEVKNLAWKPQNKLLVRHFMPH